MKVIDLVVFTVSYICIDMDHVQSLLYMKTFK
nr:MAG TPA: hypothetical protein [Bacteriophage sp.]